MLEDAAKIRRVVLSCGTVNLRKGIEGLAIIVGDKYHQNPFEKETLFLFCGRCSDRIKGLLWMGMDFSCSISVLKQNPCPGPAPRRRLLNLQRNNSIILCSV